MLSRASWSVCFLALCCLASFTAASSANRSTLRQSSSVVDRVNSLRCNHDIKKTFSGIRFDYFDEKPTKSSREIREICPYIHYTCCSHREISAFQAWLQPQIRNIESYYKEMHIYFGRLAAFDTEKFLANFQRLSSGNFPRCKLIEQPEEFELTISKMVNMVPDVQREIENLTSLISKYFSGFLCTMCDPEDHKFIKIDDKGQMEMTFDISMCNFLLNMKRIHYQLTLQMIEIYKVADQLSCLYVTEKVHMNMIYKIVDRLNAEIQEIDGCINVDDTQMHVYTDDRCKNSCKKRIFFQQYINSYEFMQVAEIGYRMMAAFNKEQFEFTEAELQDIKNEIVDADTPDFFRKYFTVWLADCQNAYNSLTFKRTLAYAGINWFDNMVVMAVGLLRAALAMFVALQFCL